MTSTPNALTAVAAGVFSFLSPCVLPLLPGYLAMMARYRSLIDTTESPTTESPTPDTGPADAKQADPVKAGARQANTRQADTRPADAKQADPVKAGARQANTRQADARQTETGQTASVDNLRTQLVVSVALFSAGFTLVFCALGAAATSLGSWLLSNQSQFSKLAGAVIIFFGINISGIISIPALQREKRFHITMDKFGPVGPFVAGLAFAFGWTPCIGPVLGPILALAATESSVTSGVALLGLYSIGLSLPFFASALALQKLQSSFTWVKQHYRSINIVSGLVMVCLGVTMVAGKLGVVSGYVSMFLEHIGLVRLTKV